MKREELRNCDLVVLRDGSLGIILERNDEVFILYQEMGFDILDLHYDEDMKEVMDGPEYDIMQVYHSDYGIVSFATYEDDGDLVFERDENWVRPSEEERAEIDRKRREALEQESARLHERALKTKVNVITVMAQAFYGNRVITETTPDHIDARVLGWTGEILVKDEKIDRTILPVPGSDQVVLIYNKYQEEKKRAYREKLIREEGYVLKPLATIPEEGIELYSRCIACRMGKDGTLQSLQPEDGDVLMKYLAE